MTKEQLWDAFASLPDHQIMQALPPSWQSSAPVTPKPRRGSRVASFFLDNGWVAAVLSTVVAVGIIVAIVLAGRGEPVEPAGTDTPESEIVSESAAPESEIVSESAAPERESETLPSMPELTDPTSLVVLSESGQILSVPGDMSYRQTLEDGEWVRLDADVLPAEDRILEGNLPTLTMDAGSTFYVQGYDPTDWTVGYAMSIYVRNGSSVLPPLRLDEPDSIAELSPGTYFVEYLLTGEGPLVEVPRGRETYRYRYLFCLVLTGEGEESTPAPSIEDWLDAPVSDGLQYTSHGDGTCSLTGIGSFAGLHLVIPEISPDGDRVTEIAATAFKDNDTFATLTVPGSVETIRGGTFATCRQLQYVRLSEGVRCIEEQVFGEQLGKLYLPASISEIQGTGFAGCSITRTYLADVGAWCGVTLGTWFHASPLCVSREIYVGDEKLHDLVIPDGVTVIRERAFNEVSLRSITLSDSVQTIERHAFGGALLGSLDELTLGSGLRELSAGAFQIDNLQRLNITDIGAFVSLNFAEEADNPLCTAREVYCDGVLLENLVIPDTVTRIGDHAFYRYKALKSVTLPDTPIEIGTRAFGYCTNLQTLQLGGTTRIGEEAFNNCPFNQLALPATLTYIGDRAFTECDNISSVHIPGSVREIGHYAFMDAERLSTVTMDEGVVVIGNMAFSGTRCSRVNLPSTLETLGNSAFYHTYLTSVTIPASVKRIGSCAFKACYYLSNITIEEGVEVIGDGAFWDNRALLNIVLPDSVTTLEANAFRDCQKLQTITFPAALTTIGEQAFQLTGALSTVYFGGTEAEWSARDFHTLFTHCTVHFEA